MPQSIDAALPDDFVRLLQFLANHDVTRIRLALRQPLRRAQCAEIVPPVPREISNEVPVRDCLHAIDAIAIDVKVAHPAFERRELQMPRRREGRVRTGYRIVARDLFDVPEQGAAETLARFTGP